MLVTLNSGKHRYTEEPAHPPPLTSSPGPRASSQSHLPTPQLPEASQGRSISLHSVRSLSVAVVLTGSFAEPPLWQFRYRIEDVSHLVLAPELRGLQAPTSHHTEESPSLTPQAGSPRSPAKDRPPQNLGRQQPAPALGAEAPQPRPRTRTRSFLSVQKSRV